jgi:hypothetical protein
VAQAICDRSPAPETTDWGTPERIFDLSGGKNSGQQTFVVASCALGVPLCQIMAIPLLVCAVKPFGKNAPPPMVCYGIRGAFAALALVSAYGVYYFAFGSPRTAGSYRLFRKGLMVIRPGQDVRRIHWVQIGPERPPSSLNRRHVFPVGGGADVTFNYLCAEHEALAAAITRKTTQARWTQLLGPAAVAGISASWRAPAFLVHDPDDAGLYRVSPLAGHLLFVRVGDGCAAGTRGFKARPLPTQGGLAGGVAGWMQMKQVERLQQALDAFEGVDERRLFDMALGLRGSRLIAPDELAEVQLTKAGWWKSMTAGVRIVGVLRFKHAAWGEKRLYFEALQQVVEAADLLQNLLGRDFRAEAARLVARG